MRECLGLNEKLASAKLEKFIQNAKDIYSIHNKDPLTLITALQKKTELLPEEEQLLKDCKSIRSFFKKHYEHEGGFKHGMKVADIPYRGRVRQISQNSGQLA